MRWHSILRASRFLAWVAVVAGAAAAGGVTRAVDVEVLVGPSETVPGPSSNSALVEPFGMEFDNSGNMVIVELGGGRILTWSRGAGLTHVAGGSEAGYVDGPAMQARFNRLHNLVILPDGNILLSDHLNHAIRRFDPTSNTVSTLAGTGKQGEAAGTVSASAATFAQPICVAAAPDHRSLLIADIGNHVIRRLDFDTDLVTIVAGNGSRGVCVEGALATDSPLLDPRGAIQNASGEIYLIQRNGHSLLRVDAQGRISTVAGNGKAGFGDGGREQSQLNGPKHLCFGPQGVVFIADDNNHSVRRFDPASGELTTVDLGAYKLKRPHGVCVHQGWLYIADSYHHRVLRVRL